MHLNVILSVLPNVILSGVEGWRTLCAETGYWIAPV